MLERVSPQLSLLTMLWLQMLFGVLMSGVRVLRGTDVHTGGASGVELLGLVLDAGLMARCCCRCALMLVLDCALLYELVVWCVKVVCCGA